MSALRDLAENRPVAFVLLLFLAQPLLAMMFVVPFRALGLDTLPLRLIIPIAQSVFAIWILRILGWFDRGGFTTTVRDLHVYWYPVLIAFAPVLIYGTMEISPGWIVFYAAAVLFTGVSEEVFARSIMIPALLRYGKRVALVVAASLFSAGHFVNLFFESFGTLEWIDKFVATFGFAILYGALFLRTGNVWPLIVLHAVHDYSYVTSGSAGPFTVEPFDVRLHITLACLNALYGLYIVAHAHAPQR